MTAMIALVFCSIFVSIHAAVVNIDTNQNVSTTWMETGYANVNSVGWTAVISTKLRYTNPVVFAGVPMVKSAQPTDNLAVVSRVKSAGVTDGYLSFSLKLYTPDCTSQWYTPINITSASEYSVAWMVVEEGGFMVDDLYQYVVGVSEVSTTKTKITWSHSYGTTCPGDAYAPGAIFAIQSLVNDMLLFVRTTPGWFQTTTCQFSWKAGNIFLESRDGLDVLQVADIQPEMVGYFLFSLTPHYVDCVDSNALEFSQQSSDRDISYISSNDGNIYGMFAAVLTYVGGDAITLKSNLLSESSFHLYLQEDLCSDEETFHYAETVSYIVFGPTTSTPEYCAVHGSSSTSLTHPPTMAPTAAPTSSPRHDSGSANKKSDNNTLLLAVLLPICLLLAVGAIGFAARAYYAAGHKPLDDSAHAGLWNNQEL